LFVDRDFKQLEQVVFRIHILADGLQTECKCGVDFACDAQERVLLHQVLALVQVDHGLVVVVQVLVRDAQRLAHVALQLLVVQVGAEVLGLVQVVDAVGCHFAVNLCHVLENVAQFDRTRILLAAVLENDCKLVCFFEALTGFFQFPQLLVYVANVTLGDDH